MPISPVYVLRAGLFGALMAFGAGMAVAQTTAPADAPAEQPQSTDAATPDVVAEGDSYVAATFDDWELVCVKMPEGTEGGDPCQIYQLLRDGQGNATAEISLFPLDPGQEAVAGATVLTPLETLLTSELVMQIDANTAKRYPFTFCTAIGCIARVGFTAAEVDAFRRGSVAKWFLVPVAAPDQVIELSMSLKGFTAAYRALSE
jgi:invasion protein IalB